MFHKPDMGGRALSVAARLQIMKTAFHEDKPPRRAWASYPNHAHRGGCAQDAKACR